MEPMVTDDGPPKRMISLEVSDPPPPGTMVNVSTDILHELSKFERFDESTCYWPDWSQRLQEHFDLFNVPSDKRVKIFIDRISNAAYEKLRGLCKPFAPLDKSLDELWKIMDRYFVRYWNILRERVKFIRRRQRVHESMLKYATELKLWGRNCRFPESWLQEALITQFCNGIRSEEIRSKVCNLCEDDFDRVIDFACKIEGMQASVEAAADETATDEAAPANITNAVDSTDADQVPGEAQISDPMEIDASSDGVVCYNCFEPGHKSPACELKKKRVSAANKKSASKTQTGESSNQKNAPNPSKNQPTNRNKNQAKNQSKNQWTNKSTNQVKKQNANQFKFQNKNQFKNQYRSQYAKPFPNYSDQPSAGGQFDDDIKNLLRNQYKDLHRKEYSNQSYSKDYSNRTLSTTYEPNRSLFYR